MLTKLPSASQAEIDRAATQIANVLRARLGWHQNFTRMTRVPQVQTNVGIWIYYGISQPREVGKVGDVGITKAFPHSLNLLACSLVPTSQQKVLLVEAVTLRVARLLGAPADAIAERKDPVRHEALVIELARLEHEDRAEEADPYKTVAEPFTISLRWPAPDDAGAAAGSGG